MAENVIQTLPNPDRKRFPVVSQCLAHEVEIEEEKYGKTEKVKVPMPDCNKVLDGVCICYGNPSNMWRLGCPMASNKIQITAKGKPINPLKASKRGTTSSFATKRKNR